MKKKVFKKILLFIGLLGAMGMAWCIVRMNELGIKESVFKEPFANYLGFNIITLLGLGYGCDDEQE